VNSKTNQQFLLLPAEKRAVLTLSLIYAVRMLGLFLLIPVMMLYAGHFPDATGILAGIAVGVYGLTQALLQIPFGLLSDRWGRRLVITAGLVIFIFGSLIAAFAESIYILIAGRALQGAGAIAAVILALVADTTHESRRSFAMAIIGISIGGAFIAALVLGPLVYSWVGGRGLFLLTAMMAVLAIAALWLGMPPIAPKTDQAHTEKAIFRLAMLFNRNYAPLNIGIFSLHAVLTASFVALPLILRDTMAIPAGQHWQVYLVVMGLSLVIMLPCLVLAERKGRNSLFVLSAALLMLLSQLWLALFDWSFYPMMIALILFFAGFNALEAVLPSLASKRAPPQQKGAMMGVFSTCQFAGVFTGGLLGGLLLDFWGLHAIFILSSGIIAAWVLIAIRLAGTNWAATGRQQHTASK
jgi:MFS family permease